MAKMFIKTIALSPTDNPLTWDNSTYTKLIENNIIVGYLLSIKPTGQNENMSLNLYLLPPNTFYEGNLDLIELTHTTLKSAFLQWLETLSTDSHKFQFRNPPLDLWLDIRLNWINALCIRIHQRYGTDVGEAQSTAYMTILKLYDKGNIYFGNLHYLEIAIYTAIKKEHAYMRNRLTGKHPDAIHLDASPGDFNLSIDDAVADFHEIIMAPTWETEEEQRYNEIWENMKEDLKEDFSEREIEQICKGSAIASSLYRRLLKWRKEHHIDEYL